MNRSAGGSVSFDDCGYRVEWSHRRSQGFGTFRYMEAALEKIGFELCDDGKYEFGDDPDETLDELMARSGRRRRASLVRVHTGRNPHRFKRRKPDNWLTVALVCSAIGFVVGRWGRDEK